MKRAILVALGTGAVISSAAAIGIGAAASTAAGDGAMSRAEYESALRKARQSGALALERCEALEKAAREYCRAEAGAQQTISVADLEAGYRRTRETSRAAQRARIDARYQLDRARCQALSGFKRDKCLVQAHAAKGRALLDAAAPYEVRYQ